MFVYMYLWSHPRLCVHVCVYTLTWVIILLKLINFFSTFRCRNILAIQQNLTNITMTREADLDRARQFYELLYLSPDVSVCYKQEIIFRNNWCSLIFISSTFPWMSHNAVILKIWIVKKLFSLIKFLFRMFLQALRKRVHSLLARNMTTWSVSIIVVILATPSRCRRLAWSDWERSWRRGKVRQFDELWEKQIADIRAE